MSSPLHFGKTSELSWQGDRSLTPPQKTNPKRGHDKNNDESADLTLKMKPNSFQDGFKYFPYKSLINFNNLQILSHGVLGLVP